MLSASSPITFPQSSSPPAPKRARPAENGLPRPKPRQSGPFMLDNDDSESENEVEVLGAVPAAKRRMLEHPREHDSSIPDRQPGSDTQITVPDIDEPQESAVTTDASTATQTPSRLDDVASILATNRPLFSASVMNTLAPATYTMKTCDGKEKTIKQRKQTAAVSYETIVAARSKTKEGRAKRDYYGIAIHELIDSASKELANKPEQRPQTISHNDPMQSVETSAVTGRKPKKTLLWTEKYRARNFMDLCGDDGTNRLVLRWLKRWDPVVFPGMAKAKPVVPRRPGFKQQNENEEKPHRKILLLTGPPGLGKTTLAHVCAKQAGYEVMEINASDDRSRDVVKGRIRTALGTESVKTLTNSAKDADGPRKVAKPACVVVDEVDGVTTGSGASGDGGFVKALIDLVLADQRNNASGQGNSSGSGRKKKGDDFRMMRPLILICNDVYHPSLRPLRQSNLAEIIHVGRPGIDAVVGRLKAVFEKEGIPCDKDAARKLCESAWGMTSGIDAKRGAESTVEGDLRGVMVVGEWVAGRFRSSRLASGQRLTRQWIDANILHDLQSGAAGSRGLGRGSVKDIVGRVFQEGGGFPKKAMDLSAPKNKHEQPEAELGFGEHTKKHAMERLRQMADTSGEISYIMTEIFAEYPNREFNDDCYLTKPNQAYEWLHFHDTCQSRLFASQEWELAPYLSQPVLACHDLFASPRRYVAPNANAGYDKRWGASSAAEDDAAAVAPPLPFTGPRADFQAHEAEKQNRAQLQGLLGQLSPSLARSFRSVEDVAAEFLPWLLRVVSPDVKPVVVGGSQGAMASVRKESERAMVRRACEVLADVGVALQRGKIESDVVSSRGPQYVYRMEPDLDALATFETAVSLVSSMAPVRYAVRHVLDQELQRTIVARENAARQARYRAGANGSDEAAAAPTPAARFDSKGNIKGTKKLGRGGSDEAVAAMGGAAAAAPAVKRDFFGRIVQVPEHPRPLREKDGNARGAGGAGSGEPEHKVWVTYHEGLNNAVRKPLSLQDFMRGL